MNKIEQNIAESFKLAKNDIVKLQQSITVINQKQERIIDMIKKFNDEKNILFLRIKKLESKKQVRGKNNLKSSK